MKKWIIMGFLLLSTVCYGKFSEGQIEMSINNAMGKGDLVLKVSPKAARYSVNMNAAGMKITMAFLVKYDKPNVVYQLDDANKTYSIMDLSQLGAKEPKKAVKTSVKVTKLGTETLLGYKTTHVKVESNGNISEMWVTKEIGLYEMMKKIMKSSKGAKEQYNMYLAMEKKGYTGFPLKSIYGSGEQKITTLVTKVEKKKWPAHFFEIPKGYKKTEGAGSIMNQLGSGQNMEALKKMIQKNMTPEQMKQMQEMMKKMGTPPKK